MKPQLFFYLTGAEDGIERHNTRTKGIERKKEMDAIIIKERERWMGRFPVHGHCSPSLSP